MPDTAVLEVLHIIINSNCANVLAAKLEHFLTAGERLQIPTAGLYARGRAVPQNLLLYTIIFWPISFAYVRIGRLCTRRNR